MTRSTEMRTGHVVSADGTRIGYRRVGTGPGLVLVQGAMATAAAYDDLARALAGRFTVYSAERRGRGLSPKEHDATHTIARDVEDLDALTTATGATMLFGLSSGAVITLEAARTLPQLTRVAAYEPPFYDGAMPLDGVRAVDDAVERADWPAALVAALRTAGTAPAPIRALPAPAARLLARVVLAVEGRFARARGDASLRDLLPGVRFDFSVVAQMQDAVPALAEVDLPVLLLSGTRSPAFLRRAVTDLADVLPRARVSELDGFDHGSPWNSRGSQPAVLADVLTEFFAAGP